LLAFDRLGEFGGFIDHVEGSTVQKLKAKLKAGQVLWLSAAAAGLWLLGPPPSVAASEQSAISQLASFTAQGVVKQASGELTSWGMSELGFPSTNGSAELANLLEQVVEELDAIKQEVAGLECIDNATDAQAAAARIQSAWTTYQLSVEASFIDSTTLDSWTSYVRGVGSDSLTADLQLISDDFTGQGSGQSILASCETASGVTPPKEGTLDDRDAWAFTTNLTNYYADTAIVGVAMLADDFHLQAYQAWLNEGNLPSDTTTDDLPVTVCGDPPPNTPRAGACASAADYYTTYRENVVAILDYGGAPYSTDDQWLLNGRGSLWVVNYDDFMLAGGYSSSCVATNSASTPCGAGVGAATLSQFYKLDSTSDEVSYGDYVVAWTPADATAWSSLLKDWSSDHLVDYLSGLGLDRSSLENRFFYTGDTVSGDLEVTAPFLNGNAHFHTLEVACFVSPESPHDSLAQPVCNENELVDMGASTSITPVATINTPVPRSRSPRRSSMTRSRKPRSMH
jgi:hypothetical protein